jgi:hypothetical protein
VRPEEGDAAKKELLGFSIPASVCSKPAALSAPSWTLGSPVHPSPGFRAQRLCRHRLPQVFGEVALLGLRFGSLLSTAGGNDFLYGGESTFPPGENLAALNVK